MKAKPNKKSFNESLPGYPLYPEADILANEKRVDGDNLDVPGSELDDEAEDIGSEDEENNYYSRGQD